MRARVVSIWNGDEEAASYLYAEDGRLESETLRGVSVSGGFLSRSYSDELVQLPAGPLGPGAYYRATRVTTRSHTSVIRDVRSISDHLGRKIRECDLLVDPTCASPIVEWVYDSKGAYATGPFVVEGDARVVSLTDKNQKGRLAYVKHPAGATFYEYDALGRITMQLAHDGPVPAVAVLLTETTMKATELSYFDGTGELMTMRYPSGRIVEHVYGNDRRGPAALVMHVNPTVDPLDVELEHHVASAILYDVAGAPKSWEWGSGLVPAPKHTITRDMLGRVTKIKDLLGAAVKTELEYLSYDGDGDVTEVRDNGPYATVLNTSFTAPLPQSWTFAYGERDMLQDWTDMDGPHMTSIDDDNGKRLSETFGGTTYDYAYSGERVEERGAAGSEAGEVSLTWAHGAVTSIDYGDDGVLDIDGLTYSARGDLISATTAAGSYTLARDDQMRRWTKGHPTAGQAHHYRYAPGGELIDAHKVTSGFARNEFVYLAGVPIAVTHTETSHLSPTSWWLSPDAMGTPRRAFETNNTSFRQATRLIMNAWGKGEQADDLASLGWTGVGVPALDFRLPGQVADDELFTLVENRWRAYLPDLGIYLGPDPAHAAGARSHATPNAFLYAAGRSLLFSDPDGRRVLGLSETVRARLTSGSLRDDYLDLERAPWFTVRVIEVDSNLPLDCAGSPETVARGGGMFCGSSCTNRAQESCGSVATYIYINVPAWNSYMSGAPHNLPSGENNLGTISAHELGHAWFNYDSIRSGAADLGSWSDDVAITWENTLRTTPRVLP